MVSFTTFCSFIHTDQSRTLDLLYTLVRILEGAFEFVQPTHTCVLRIWRRLMTFSFKMSLVGHSGEYGVDGFLLRAIQSLYCQSQSLVCIAGSKSDPFPLFIIFMDRMSRHSRAAEGVKFSSLRIPSLLFVDDVVLLASSNRDLQLSLGQFGAECEVVGMRISTSNSEALILSQKRVDCP